MWALMSRCCLDVLRRGRAPAGGRRAAVKGGVLLGVEQVEHCSGNSSEPPEVADCGRTDVDPAEAAELCLHVADAGRAAVEATRSRAEAAK